MTPLHIIQLAQSPRHGVIERLHFPLEVMLMRVRWYAAYPLSLPNLEEMMAEQGVLVDHATVHRWALKVLPGASCSISFLFNSNGDAPATTLTVDVGDLNAVVDSRPLAWASSRARPPPRVRART